MAGTRLAVRQGIAILGAGNWGSSLASGAIAAGIPLMEVVVGSSGRRRGGLGDARVVVRDQASYDAEVLWICVPDKEISAAAERIVARRGDLRGQVVVHSSGALTVAELALARRAGARVGGIAPVFTFPTTKPAALAGVLFAVESPLDGGKALWRTLSGLVRRLGGKPVRISPEKKALYHAAATMASPLLVSALQAAVETAGLAGFEAREAEAVVRVLATATLRNFFDKGATRSFSGAFARGDAETVELHLQALLEHPKLHEIYVALARNAVASLPVKNGSELKRVLDLDGVKPGVRD